MATLNETLAAIERHVGIPHSRSRSVARRLQEAGVVPMGAPGVAPVVEIEHFTSLVAALGADRTLRTAAETLREFIDLVPGGCTTVPGEPNAFSDLFVHVELALHGSPETKTAVRRMQFEFCHTWPEYCRHHNGKAVRFVAPGALPSHWRTNHRTSTVISGAGLADAAIELFGDK